MKRNGTREGPRLSFRKLGNVFPLYLKTRTFLMTSEIMGLPVCLRD